MWNHIFAFLTLPGGVSFSEVFKGYKKWDIGVTWVKTETKLKFFIHSFTHSYKDLLRS